MTATRQRGGSVPGGEAQREKGGGVNEEERGG